MKKITKIQLTLSTLLLATIMLSVSAPLCSAADSPQYILSAYAVNSAGNPTAATIVPTANEPPSTLQ